MVRSLTHWFAPLALLAGMAGAQAQAPQRAARPDPLDPQAAVPATRHESAFAAYRRYADTEPIAWGQANATVNRIGGWRAYAREASEPAAAPGAAPPATPGRVQR